MVGWAVIPFIPVFNALAMWFAPMPWKMRMVMIVSGIMVLITAILSTSVEKQIWASNTAYYAAVEELAHVGPFTILDAPYVFGFGVLSIYYTGLALENSRRKKHFFSVIAPAYQKAMDRWRGLNYCARCGGVFTGSPPPGQPRFVPVNKMNRLLYDRKSESQPENL